MTWDGGASCLPNWSSAFSSSPTSSSSSFILTHHLLLFQLNLSKTAGNLLQTVLPTERSQSCVSQGVLAYQSRELDTWATIAPSFFLTPGCGPLCLGCTWGKTICGHSRTSVLRSNRKGHENQEGNIRGNIRDGRNGDKASLPRKARVADWRGTCSCEPSWGVTAHNLFQTPGTQH